MKSIIICAIALSLPSGALAVTVTAFSDGACATQAGAKVEGMTNLLVCSLNTGCAFTSGRFVKMTDCSTSVSGGYYDDSACTGAKQSDLTATAGSCTPIGGMDTKSIKITCASASSGTLAIFAMAAAAVAYVL